MKILVRAYYGVANLGDDAILLAALKWARRNGHEVAIALSGQAFEQVKEVIRLSGAKAEILDDSMSTFKRVIRSCDGFLIGGGGLFPSDNWRSLGSWLKRALYARLNGKFVAFFGVGVNPVKNPASSAIWSVLGAISKVIHVRDHTSYNAIARFVANKRKLIEGADLVFTVPPEDLLAPRSEKTSKRSLAIAVANPWSDEELTRPEVARRKETLIAGLSRLASGLAEAGWTIEIVPFFLPGDAIFATEILSRTRKENISIIGEDSVAQRVHALSAADWIITMRFHGLVLASLFDIPALTIAYDHKLESLAKDTLQSDSTVQFGIRDSEFYGFEKDVDFAKVEQIAATLSQDPQAAKARITAPIARLRNHANEALDRFTTALQA